MVVRAVFKLLSRYKVVHQVWVFIRLLNNIEVIPLEKLLAHMDKVDGHSHSKLDDLGQ